MSNQETVLDVIDLVKHYPIKAGVTQHVVGHVRAVDGVSFSIKAGQTFGLVGESGCGKSTIGRTLLRLTPPTSGKCIIEGKDIFALSRKELRAMRPKMQMIFQDPYSSLDPRMSVSEIIGEAVREHKIVPKSEYRDYVLKVMQDCGLRTFQADRYPHEFSGGQRQRIGIARALATQPKFVVCDEAVSALDVSIQAQIINLLQDLKEQENLTYLFITHDLSVVKYISVILLYSYQTRRSLACLILASYGVSRSLRSDHRNVNICRRHDLSKVDIKAVSKHEHVALLKVRLDVILI